MIFPFIPFIFLYSISDFLIDQKDELVKFDRIYKERKDSEIKDLRKYIYNQGLQALRIHERKLPKCIKDYYLGLRGKPEMDQISKELQKMNYSDYQFTGKLVRIIVMVVITLMTILAIFF